MLGSFQISRKRQASFECSAEEWLELALAYPGVELVDLNLPIILQSTRLTGFHNDPADQIIVLTAKVYIASLLTQDQRILNYADTIANTRKISGEGRSRRSIRG